MPDPLAYFLTWPTYGTWLPGDDRGWVEYQRGWQLPDAARKLEAQAKMTDQACVLNAEQREVVERTIREHCEIRGWELFAVNCRTNHVHVVVAADRTPEIVVRQLKAWCSRRLKELERTRRSGEQYNEREQWWAERGSRRWLNDENSLDGAILYVQEGQAGMGFSNR